MQLLLCGAGQGTLGAVLVMDGKGLPWRRRVRVKIILTLTLTHTLSLSISCQLRESLKAQGDPNK